MEITYIYLCVCKNVDLILRLLQDLLHAHMYTIELFIDLFVVQWCSPKKLAKDRWFFTHIHVFKFFWTVNIYK
jgi:hypothetical protein